ncbi:MAG TPA: hypothetical protein VFR76_13050, partial [Verrucomicrobiae bacterium]|nr:hypothetical protein [Verrucomicrobiae bacterium]
GFTFPTNPTLVAGGLALLVNFDPADAAVLDAFRAKFGVTNPAVQIFGPYSGKLGNRSDRVAVEKPQYPDFPGGSYSWVIVDEVIYGNQTPWPASANGVGNSLQRTVLNGCGNNPANWFAAPPTAGRASTSDRDGDGMPDEWELANQLDPDNPADAAADADGDGYTNLEEYRAGTDPRDPASALKFTSVNAQGSGLRLQFIAMAGHSYTVQRRDDLTGGAWLKLQDFQASPTNGFQELMDWSPTNSPQHFYRLVTPSIP